jgi:hypothetical protein
MDSTDHDIEYEEDGTDEQSSNKPHGAEHLAPWQFKPGVSGNPLGRPVGTISLKEYAKKMIQEMTEPERMEFLRGLPKKVIWEMAEGKPKQDMDLKGEVTSKIIAIDE